MGSRPGRAIPRDTNGTDSSLADARTKRVVPGRYKKAGKLRIFVMSQLMIYRDYVLCFERGVI